MHKPIYIEGEKSDIPDGGIHSDNDTYIDKILSFANNINTSEGGTHLIGFKSALTRTINHMPPTANVRQEHASQDQGRRSVKADRIISVASAPQFGRRPNQTRKQ